MTTKERWEDGDGLAILILGFALLLVVSVMVFIQTYIMHQS